jgi:hypothetical protein
MFSRRRPAIGSGLVPLLTVILLGCGSAAPSTTPGGTGAAAATETAASSATASESFATGGMQVRFMNLTDGGTAAATLDSKGRPMVAVKIEVNGGIPFSVTLTANGLPAVDETGHLVTAENAAGVTPFSAEIAWSPLHGGGEYTLVATAMDANKNIATATVHVTVTGVPHTTLPPALTPDQARVRVTDLIANEYKVTIPKPSLQRFDFPENPTRSRWIGAAYYQGTRYYVSIFDDGHVEWATGPYSDPAHRRSDVYMCRPAGAFKVLVVFVDYGNTGTVKADTLAQVPVVVTWLNGLYKGFATSQGFSSPLMSVQADAAWVASPPAVNQLLTAAQIKTLTGKDTTAYDFTMQIDLDVKGGWGVHENPGFMEPGGGFALNGCGADSKMGVTNVWSSLSDPSNLQGALVMDFNHELSHLFGMLDDYPWKQGVRPDGSGFQDWIPYVLFGWTDTDGDGIPEIVDPTPYGTSGPKP